MCCSMAAGGRQPGNPGCRKCCDPTVRRPPAPRCRASLSTLARAGSLRAASGRSLQTLGVKAFLPEGSELPSPGWQPGNLVSSLCAAGREETQRKGKERHPGARLSPHWRGGRVAPPLPAPLPALHSDLPPGRRAGGARRAARRAAVLACASGRAPCLRWRRWRPAGGRLEERRARGGHVGRRASGAAGRVQARPRRLPRGVRAAAGALPEQGAAAAPAARGCVLSRRARRSRSRAHVGVQEDAKAAQRCTRGRRPCEVDPEGD